MKPVTYIQNQIQISFHECIADQREDSFAVFYAVVVKMMKPGCLALAIRISTVPFVAARTSLQPPSTPCTLKRTIPVFPVRPESIADSLHPVLTLLDDSLLADWPSMWRLSSLTHNRICDFAGNGSDGRRISRRWLKYSAGRDAELFLRELGHIAGDRQR